MSESEELIGKVLEGKVTNVTRFGAFVMLDVGQEGLVHISEIANEFISDINDFVKIGDSVNVKVLARNAKQKLELSIKRVEQEQSASKSSSPPEKNTVSVAPVSPFKRSKSGQFEDKIGSFLKRSEERQIDIRRNLKNKQGITKRKR